MKSFQHAGSKNVRVAYVGVKVMFMMQKVLLALFLPLIVMSQAVADDSAQTRGQAPLQAGDSSVSVIKSATLDQQRPAPFKGKSPKADKVVFVVSAMPSTLIKMSY
jgi:hypothetical protein